MDPFSDLVSGLDYPMFLVTTVAADGERSGCLVGFASQASIDPPRLLAMLSKVNHTFEVAERSDRLAVHFLHRDNGELAALFGEDTGDEVDKFSRCDWEPGPGEVPVLPGTRGWVIGSVVARWDAGDHVANLIDVEHVELGRSGPQLSYQATRDLQPGHPA